AGGALDDRGLAAIVSLPSSTPLQSTGKCVFSGMAVELLPFCLDKDTAPRAPPVTPRLPRTDGTRRVALAVGAPSAGSRIPLCSLFRRHGGTGCLSTEGAMRSPVFSSPGARVDDDYEQYSAGADFSALPGVAVGCVAAGECAERRGLALGRYGIAD